MNQEETEEMRLLNRFLDGLSYGFLHWVLQLSKTHHLLAFWWTLELLIVDQGWVSGTRTRMGGICGSHFFTLETGTERGQGNLVWWGRLRWFGTAPSPSSLVFSHQQPQEREKKNLKWERKRERKIRKDRKQIFIGGGKLVISHSGQGGAYCY